MASGTRVGLRNKDGESHSSWKSSDTREGMSNASAKTATTSSSKQSSKGASSGQTTSSLQRIRKSERLEKQTPPSTPLTRKSERLLKHNTPSPLRRLDRGKKHSPSASNQSGKSSSPLDAKRKKEKKEKSIQQLTMESKKVISSEKYDRGSISSKRKRMGAHSYKSLFNSQKRKYSKSDTDGKLESRDTSPQIDSIESRGSDSKLFDDMEDGVHKCDRVVIEHAREVLGGPSEAAPPGSVSGFEHINANISGNDVEANLSSSHEHYLSKKNPNQLGGVDGDISVIDCTVRATLDEITKRLKDNSTAEILKVPELVADTVGRCDVCCKKQRLAYNSPEEELCSCTAVEKDAGDVELAFNSESVERCAQVTGLNETLSDIQTVEDENICVKCKQPGDLLCCCGEGCRRCYHLSCLNPILYDAPPGVWHCSYCTKKKIEFSIYAVTKGAESIWDAREVVVSGTRRQKQYLVKYQGLAHVYNQWIPESQLLLETISLVAKYNENNQSIVWNSEWTVPSRLLRKRPVIMPLEPEDKCSKMGNDIISDCRYEWLVKWCGLDYVHATWEVENASFLQSSRGQKLIKEYEIRYEKAKRVVDKSTKGSSVKLKDRLSDGGSNLSDDCYLHNVNKLWELWHKSQSAVVFDEQERFANVIFFISSLLSNDHQPFLIISTCEAASQWEAEFMRLAPSVDTVVYKGNIDTRRSIRALEFHEEDNDGVMLQVLLSPLEVVIEDTTEEYSNLLSLLGSPDDPDKAGGLKSDTIDDLVKLKERFSRFTAYAKFVEYFVPAEISNLQLEQYCATLLANAAALRSNCKSDLVGASREILMTLRKCCDHPYLVDSSLQPLIIAGLTPEKILEVGIKASGKLQLLHEILSKIRNQRLRALVLFQSIVGPGGIAIGDVLNDFVRQKFGQNSYERIDACLVASKKQAALNRFNNIEGEPFVFLLESCACHSSIKLSVDAVVIFDSEWNPANDLKALQRLSIRSQSEQINVFRLYSSCTIEEKVLILGKQNLNLENLQTIRYITSLLMWGASCLFSRLDEYHAGNSTSSATDISSGQELLCEVVSELSALESGSFQELDKCEPVISKVFRGTGTYSTNCPLLGERKVQSTNLEEPHIFWKKLLDGKNPRWKFPLGPTPRSRKRVQYAKESPRRSDFESDDTGRKRKKVVNTPAISLPLEQVESQVGAEASTAVAANKSQSLPVPSNKLNAKNTASSLSNRRCITQVKSPSDEQKSLHAFIKAEMVKLCEILKLSKEVEQMIDRFLEYVMENHHVNKEPVSILQAFQMSLCWIAASILKQKIDKRESLELGKRILNFKCTEEEASLVYLKLRLLKKTFLQLPGDIRASALEAQEPNNKLTGNDLEKTIKKIQKKCDKRMTKLHLKHKKEIQVFHKMWVEKKEKLEADHQMEVKFIHTIRGNGPMRIDKLKMSDIEFAKKMAKHERLKELQLKELGAKHSAAAEEERKKIANWVAEAKSCSDQCRIVNEVLIHGSESEDETGISNMTATGKSMEIDIVQSGVNIEQGLDGIAFAAQESDAIPPNLPVGSAVEVDGCSTPVETLPILLNSSSGSSDIGGLEASSAPRVKQHKEDAHSSQGIEDVPSADIITSEKHVTDEVPSTGQKIEMPSVKSGNTGCEMGHAVGMGISVNIATSMEQTAYEIPFTNQSNEMAPGMPGTHDHAVEASTPVESRVGNDRENIVTSDITRNKKDQLDGSSCKGMTISELPSANLTDSLPLDAVKCLQNKDSMDTSNGDKAVTESQTTTVETAQSASFDAWINSRSNNEVIENSEQLKQATEDVAPSGSQSPAASAVCNSEGSNCLQNSVASPQLLGESVGIQHQSAPQDAENTVLHPPVEHLDSAQDQNHPDLLTASRTDHEPYSELTVNSQNREPQVSPNTAEIPNRSVSQSGPNLATVKASHVQLYGTHCAASWNGTLPLPAEPLQNELKKIRKELEQAIQLHESTKLQLNSDCKKEIEEMAVQIRNRYEAKLKDVETTFLLKKTELESNKDKVLMNMLLAEAFKSKCMDLRSSGISGVQQVVPSSYMQHLHQLSLPYSMRHSPVISHHSVNPSVRPAQHSSGNFAGFPARPPQINAITPAVVNARVGGEVRAPAPHLQPFRPHSGMSSVNMTSLPCNPNQQVPLNVPVTSPLLPPLPPQQALSTSAQFSQPNSLSPASLPPVKINLSGSGNKPSESENGVQPFPHHTRLSALELLRNVHNQPSGHAPKTLHCPPSSASNAGAVDVASQVVCLSDDDN